MTADSRHTVLIYGDLRLGFWKSYILGEAIHLGPGKTCDSFAMYLGTFVYVVNHEQRYPIEGDVFQVNERTLEYLDLLQGHPYWYRRTLVPIEAGGARRDAWLYFGQDCSGELLPSGDYLKHCAAGEECCGNSSRICPD